MSYKCEKLEVKTWYVIQMKSQRLKLGMSYKCKKLEAKTWNVIQMPMRKV